MEGLRSQDQTQQNQQQQQQHEFQIPSRYTPPEDCKQIRIFCGVVKGYNGVETNVRATLMDCKKYKPGQPLKTFFEGYTESFEAKDVTSSAFTICFTLTAPTNAARYDMITWGLPFKIKLTNVPSNVANVDLKVPVEDDPPGFYEELYKLNEKLLWAKVPRKKGYGKCLYECNFCHFKISSLVTLKEHINIHLKFFPFECEVCHAAYHAYNLLKYHQRSEHKK